MILGPGATDAEERLEDGILSLSIQPLRAAASIMEYSPLT